MFPEPSDALPASKPVAAGLYLVATPIGNLRDITLRALDVLQAADLIACEDTRVTGKLLRAFGLRAPLIAYHDHNGDRQRPAILAALAAKQVVALVSDAGTPLVSDPGYKLVRAVIAEGHDVTALPGASAALTALQLSALPPDRFLFAGFPDRGGGARRSGFEALAGVPASLIFYESPHRLADSLAEMRQVFGDRPAAVARELTKLHEEVRRGSLSDLAAHYAETGGPKGEVVVVVGPPDPAASAEAAPDLAGLLRAALADGMRLRDAVDAVAGQTGTPRRQVYSLALSLDRDDAAET